MTLGLDELREAVGTGEIDTVLACMVDMQGRLVGKRFDAEFFLEHARDEFHACDYLLANDMDMEPVPGYEVTSWETGYGDFALRPDLATLRRVPWLSGTALVLCDVCDHHGEELPHSPRAVLKRQLARLAERGMTTFFASELEFYLFDHSYREAYERGYRDLKPAGYYIEDYHILQTTREEPVMRAIRLGLRGAGIPVENTKGEWGPGQEEINVRYAEALAMADRHAILKHACKEIADQHGRAVTFMAKWRYDLAGNSCHIHHSVRDAAGGRPLFHDPDDELGMSRLMKSWLAGQLRYAREITWFLAPYVNSYKRFQVGTFAPTRICWSRDNRTAGFRLVGERTPSVRIECRIGGADLNPYLAFAALIAAGLRGVEEGLELDPPHVGNAYEDPALPEVPKTLREAIALMRESALVREMLGEVAFRHYLHTAEWEQFEYDRRITDWELWRGFERA